MKDLAKWAAQQHRIAQQTEITSSCVELAGQARSIGYELAEDLTVVACYALVELDELHAEVRRERELVVRGDA